MPLIQITTKTPYYPRDDRSGEDTSDEQLMIIEFATNLPSLFVAHQGDFLMEAGTPETGVQVTLKKFHAWDVNAPDMWILIEFSEDGLDDDDQTEVTGKVKKVLLDWFEQRGLRLPRDYACDVRWVPSHGFLRIGSSSFDW